MNTTRILLLSCLGALGACSETAGPPPEADSAPPADTAGGSAGDAGMKLEPAEGIDWFEGSVEEAFATARAQGKPLYLYWGAVWCPPCHAIRETVFSTPEFRERSKLFIPVYLDGDTDNAQRYGERFGVMGYPTMIVFDSDGQEITRIPNGIDMLAYANVLDLTLDNATSASALVETVMADRITLSGRDCAMLAYHAWGQDTSILESADRPRAMRRIYDACPADLGKERTLLYIAWLDTLLQAVETPADVELDAGQRREAVELLESVLADPERSKTVLVGLIHSGADITAALTESQSPERASLTRAFLEAYERFAADETVYKRERIYTLRGRLAFERIDDPELPPSPALREAIVGMVEWADRSTPGVHQRQPIVNALGNLLDDAGMDEVAKPLLLAELEKSGQPYYYMPELAGIEQRAGNTELAIEWLRKGYDASKGPATRFQWGYYYLSGLLEMSPDDTVLIHDTTVRMIEELQKSGGLYQRPKRQLVQLESELITWAGATGGDAELSRIRESVLQVCTGDASTESRAVCEAFLEAV